MKTDKKLEVAAQEKALERFQDNNGLVHNDSYRIVYKEAFIAGARLESERLMAVIKELIEISLLFKDEIIVPDENCSCHINPPCSDCTNYAHLRDANKQLEEIDKKLKEIGIK